MGALTSCFTTLEVVAVEEVRKIVLQELIKECKNVIIPEIIQQLQFTELKLDEIAAGNNM